MASKIVVVGSANGQFKEVFEKVSGLHKKNAFSLAIIAGDLFHDPSNQSPEDEANLNELLQDKISVPLPTYFALGKSPLPPKAIEKLESNNGEVCENLYFLGKRTTIKTSEGIKIVALGGALDPELNVASSKDSFTPFYTVGDANALRGANSADILLTSEWPQNIKSGSKAGQTAAGDDKAVVSHQCLAELCAQLKPRYHFSTSNSFYEREPFFHPPTDTNEDKGYSISRFISLAPFGNTQKQKWIYAFSIDPNASAPLVVPAGTTASPLTFISKKRTAPSNDEGFSRFSKDDRYHHHQRRSNKKARQPLPGPSECFFCLSNPNLAAHLVTSIGNEAYMTTAKGPLTDSNTFRNLNYPCHMLIIPLSHSPTLPSIPEPESRTATVQEMTKYRTSLNNMLLDKSNSSEPLGSVTWEINRSTGIHAHWQFLPIQADLIKRGLVEAAFKVEAENSKYPAFETTHGKEFDPQAAVGDSLNVWLWRPLTSTSSTGGNLDGHAATENTSGDTSVENPVGIETALTLPLDSSFRFDLQFGRRVLAKLLGLEKRLQWRECAQSEGEETKDADAFKEDFKMFDFTLEE